MEKAIFFLGESISRHTPAVINNATALKLAWRPNLRFPNFLDSENLLLIMTHDDWAGEFPLLAYAAYLFALRAPSEAIPIRRDFRIDSMESFTSQREKALISLLGLPGEGELVFEVFLAQEPPSGMHSYATLLLRASQRASKRALPGPFLLGGYS